MNARERLEALEQVINAVAHPARRQILLTIHLVGGTSTAGKIAARFSCAWPTITRHLRVLENAGLLKHERRGRARVYFLVRERLEHIREWLAWFEHRPAIAAQDSTESSPKGRSALGQS